MKQLFLDIEQWAAKTVIPKKGEKNEVSPTIALAYCLERVPSLQYKQGEPTQSPLGFLS